MKIVVLDGYTINPGDLSWRGLERLGEVTCYDRTIEDTSELLKRIGDAEIVITNRTPISNEVLKLCSNLRFINVISTGADVVDAETAMECGITLEVTAADGAYSTAQTTIAMLLEICHHIQNHSDSVYRGDWESCEDFCYWLNPLTELYAKKIGVIGYDEAGQIISAIAKSMGMNVIVYDDVKTDDETDYVDIDVLVRESDVIVLNVLLPKTKKLINSNNIKKMKGNVTVISITSSEFIDEAQLAEGLNSGRIGAAAIDIVSTDNIRGDNPLLTAKNCIITPRISWATRENRKRILDEVSLNIEKYLAESTINRNHS